MIQIGGIRPGQGLNIGQLQYAQQIARQQQEQKQPPEDQGARELALADALKNDPFRPTAAPGLLTGAARVAEMLMANRGALREHEQEGRQRSAWEDALSHYDPNADPSEQMSAMIQALRGGDPEMALQMVQGRIGSQSDIADALSLENQRTPILAERQRQVGDVMTQQSIREAQATAPYRSSGAQQAPPAGYRFTQDGNLEAIPGGPADQRQTAAGQSRIDQMDASISSLTNAIGVLRDAEGHVNGSNSGFWGQNLRGIGGTPAYNLQQELEPVRAILSFENLAEMRRNSSTGGALGSIAVRELELLGSTVRSLDTAQSEAQLRQALQATRTQLERTMAAVQAARQEAAGGPQGGQQPRVIELEPHR